MQKEAILKVNPSAEIFMISSLTRQGIDELLFALKRAIEVAKHEAARKRRKIWRSLSRLSQLILMRPALPHLTRFV